MTKKFIFPTCLFLICFFFIAHPIKAQQNYTIGLSADMTSGLAAGLAINVAWKWRLKKSILLEASTWTQVLLNIRDHRGNPSAE